MMVAVSSDKRNLNRLPCSVALSETSQSGLIGELRNISLDGGFIATSAPLPQGSVVPLSFKLDSDGPGVRCEAEVVRVDADGMGVHFMQMSTQDARRLRRYVTQLMDTVGNRENAERLLDVDSRVTQPISEPEKIVSILQSGAGTKVFTIMPAKRVARSQGTLSGIVDGCLRMALAKPSDLVAGEEVLVLHTHEFVSYFFRTTVRSVQDLEAELEQPTELKYSERRASKREAAPEDATIQFAVPWRKNEMIAWDVVERTAGGLSFRADPKNAFFWPGTELTGAIYTQGGREETLSGVVVKHLTTMDEQATPWLRVGVAFGVARGGAIVTASTTAERRSSTFWQSAITSLHRAVSALEYFYHSKFRSSFGKEEAAPFTVVKFQNRGNKTVMGLLNTSFEEGSKRAIRAPLVIVAPGYGVRKEVMSALALTLTHNFRRQHRDIAVLRFDGVNNLGESQKAAGYEGEGKHCIKWTISDGVNDLLGALDWARNNRYVDPTNIVVVTGSIGSVAARRILTMPDGQEISQWIAFHGAPDAGNTVMHAAGNIDLFGNYERGIKTGVISLMGCLGDADNFARDAYEIKAATLEDARRDMRQIKAAVTWIVGTHDAYVDRNRVRDIMGQSAPGEREIIEVTSGHMPRTSDEALSQFSTITSHIWRRMYGRELVTDIPSRGWLAAIGEREWKRVRNGMPADAHAWWKDYLLGDNGLGYDAWALTPEYNMLINDQVNMVPRDAVRVLDLGAGTGNVSQALAARGFKELTAVDLVPEALERVKLKVGADRITTIPTSIEGTPKVVMARWLAGELGNVSALAARLPASAQDALSRVDASLNSELMSILRGNDLDIHAALKRARLQESLHDTLREVQNLARHCRAMPALPSRQSTASAAFASAFQSNRGLPFEDASFDAIVCSIVLSYIEHHEDSVFEMRRILKPGGTLILSSMLPDADSGKAFLNGLDLLEKTPDSALPAGFTRETLMNALRAFADHSAELLRLEEEGAFHFWDGETLSRMMKQAGFIDVVVTPSCGQDPAMAVIVQCKKA